MITQLELARRREGLTVREVAERAGVSHATVSAIETGKWAPREDTARALAGAVGIPSRLWEELQEPV